MFKNSVIVLINFIIAFQAFSSNLTLNKDIELSVITTTKEAYLKTKMKWSYSKFKMVIAHVLFNILNLNTQFKPI